jgi:hypothetical protein
MGILPKTWNIILKKLENSHLLDNMAIAADSVESAE